MIAVSLYDDGLLVEPEEVLQPIDAATGAPPVTLTHDPKIVGPADVKGHVLYRHLAEDGSLLYVGVTEDIKKRLKAHRRASWWTDVAEVHIEPMASRADALRAELEFILSEHPAHNRSDAAYRTDTVLKRELSE
ncbi:GIY-YIG nuclease family protein [Geodermatophilus pulveris]|uniref:GIY-YIG nuclease family protein n=1 Tax=Geodermatophilus pulveris TaxID=1564159 RepID=UPI000B78EDFC|nr:GIY-YIG nuclease family protein [Geodermatophilus pulveris]